jgi:hypothetical protein
MMIAFIMLSILNVFQKTTLIIVIFFILCPIKNLNFIIEYFSKMYTCLIFF